MHGFTLQAHYPLASPVVTVIPALTVEDVSQDVATKILRCLTMLRNVAAMVGTKDARRGIVMMDGQDV